MDNFQEEEGNSVKTLWRGVKKGTFERRRHKMRKRAHSRGKNKQQPSAILWNARGRGLKGEVPSSIRGTEQRGGI